MMLILILYVSMQLSSKSGYFGIICEYKLHNLNLNWITNPHCQWLCQSNDRPWPRLAASFSKATLSGDIWCSPSDDEGRAVPHFQKVKKCTYTGEITWILVLHSAMYPRLAYELRINSAVYGYGGTWILLNPNRNNGHCVGGNCVHPTRWLLMLFGHGGGLGWGRVGILGSC